MSKSGGHFTRERGNSLVRHYRYFGEVLSPDSAVIHCVREENWWKLTRFFLDSTENNEELDFAR
jgi:hypothetical protein